MPEVVHINGVLTNMAPQYRNKIYVGDEVFPVIEVKKKSASFHKYSKADRFTVPDTILGRKAEANEIDWATESDDYLCKASALKDFVPQEDLENADTVLRPQSDTMEFLMDLMRLDREKKIADLTLTFTTTTPSPKWDAADCDPSGDIELAISLCFVQPNIMVISKEVYKCLKHHAALKDYYKFTKGGVATPELIADLFDLDKVLIGPSKRNTAKKGQTPVYASVWGKHMVLAYVNPNPSPRQISLGYTFSQILGGGRNIWRVRNWREDKRGLGGGEIIQVETSTDQKIVCSDVGYILKDVIS